MRITERTAIPFGAVGAHCVHNFTAAVIIFFALGSYTSSTEIHNMKMPLSLPLNGGHVELPITLSALTAFTPIPQSLNKTETSLAIEIQNQPKTEVNDTDVDFSEHYELATSNSKSRSFCGGWWSWVVRLILMCFCLMVGEGSMGTQPEEGKEEKPGTSKDNVVKEQTETVQEGIANLRIQEEEKSEAHKNKIEDILGGPTKTYEYFRDHAFMKKCEEESRNYSESEAKEAWRVMSESERVGHAEEALTKYLRCDEKLEDFLPQAEH